MKADALKSILKGGCSDCAPMGGILLKSVMRPLHALARGYVVRGGAA
jgi:hypothetical protein